MQNIQTNIIQDKDFLAWATDLVGKPYKSGAHGPNEFDCWGLVVYIYKEILGVKLPDFFGYESIKDYPTKMQEEIFKPGSSWQQIEKPEPFSVVAMSRNKNINHVGIWLELDGQGLCFHAHDPDGVMANTVQQLKRNLFFTRIFLRYKNL